MSLLKKSEAQPGLQERLPRAENQEVEGGGGWAAVSGDSAGSQERQGWRAVVGVGRLELVYISQPLLFTGA